MCRLCLLRALQTSAAPNSTWQLSAMSFKNFGQITNDISGNNGLNAADYRIIQMAVKFAF
jgi:hypothetical protein